MYGTIRALVTHIDIIATKAGSFPKILSEDQWRKLTIGDRAVITTKFSNEAWHDLREHPSAIGEWWKQIRRRFQERQKQFTLHQKHG